MTWESERKTKLGQLIGLIAVNSAGPVGPEHKSALADWNAKVTRIFSEYMSLEYGNKLPPQDEKEIQMLEYYMNKVKHLKPIMTVDKSGGLTVTGVSDL